VKFFLKEYTPVYLLALYRKVRVTLRFFSVRALLAKNYGLQAQSDTVVILGNGPSINQLDLPSVLAGVDVIVMNSFYRHPDAHKLKIVAYCVGEQGWYAQNSDISNMLNTPSSQYWFSTDFAARLKPLLANIHLYLPGNDAVLKQHKKNLDLSHPAPYYENTSQMAIMISMSKGYKKIILLGFDHNYLASEWYLEHFYEEDFKVEASISRLYIDGADYHALIQNCERMWARYKLINSYALSRGIEIINCGKDSYLDVFRRHPLQTAMTPITKHLENIL